MITDLKELDKFFKLCRKQGVEEITFDKISVKFGSLPLQKAESSSESTDENPTEESLTPDQLIYYAVENAGVS